MPQESFHSLQDDWKVEIQDMFDVLRAKEKVKHWELAKCFTMLAWWKTVYSPFQLCRTPFTRGTGICGESSRAKYPGQTPYSAVAFDYFIELLVTQVLSLRCLIDITCENGLCRRVRRWKV